MNRHTFRVRALVDSLQHEEGFEVIEHILNMVYGSMDDIHQDSVIELDFMVSAKDISEEVGVDEEGARAFNGVDILYAEEN